MRLIEKIFLSNPTTQPLIKILPKNIIFLLDICKNNPIIIIQIARSVQ